MTTRFRLSVCCEGDAVRLSACGDLDLMSGTELCDSIVFAAEQASEVHVDLSEVRFIDSSGIAALLLAQHKAARHEGHVRVTGASPEVIRVLELAGVAHHLGIRPAGE